MLLLCLAFGGFDSKPQDSPQVVPNLFGSTPATTAGGSVFGGNAPAFGTASNGSQAPAFGSVAPTFSGADATNKPSVPPTANAGIFAFGAASNPPPFQVCESCLSSVMVSVKGCYSCDRGINPG